MAEDEIEVLPSFVIWREDNQWVLETASQNEIDTKLIAQVMERCEAFFKNMKRHSKPFRS